MFELTFESAECLTQDDFAIWVEQRSAADPSHYELLNGRIVMNPPAGYPHGRSDQKVTLRIGGFVEVHDLGITFGPDQGFALPSGDTVGPDFSLISKARWVEPPPLGKGDFLTLVPDLVVEVLSPGNSRYDRGEKKGIYERNGVREYWLLDPRGRRLTVFQLIDGRYSTGQAYEEHDELNSPLLPGLVLVLRDLLP